jgi:hypothetical protein
VWLISPLVVDYFASPRLVVDYFAYAVRLVSPLVIDYSVRRDFVLRPHRIYFSHVVCRDYLSRGNTGSTSSTPCAAATSFSGRIALTIHLDRQSHPQQLVRIDSD